MDGCKGTPRRGYGTVTLFSTAGHHSTKAIATYGCLAEGKQIPVPLPRCVSCLPTGNGHLRMGGRNQQTAHARAS